MTADCQHNTQSPGLSLLRTVQRRARGKPGGCPEQGRRASIMHVHSGVLINLSYFTSVSLTLEYISHVLTQMNYWQIF